MRTPSPLAAVLVGSLLGLVASRSAQPVTDAVVDQLPTQGNVVLVVAQPGAQPAVQAQLEQAGAVVQTPQAVHQDLDRQFRRFSDSGQRRLSDDGVVAVPADALDTMDLRGQTVVLADQADDRQRAEAATLLPSWRTPSVLQAMAIGAVFGLLGLMFRGWRGVRWAGLSLAGVQGIAIASQMVLPVEIPMVALVIVAAWAVFARRPDVRDVAAEEAEVWARLTSNPKPKAPQPVQAVVRQR